MAMQRTREVSGYYATWKLTVEVGPAEDEDCAEFNVLEWPKEKFDPVAAHFMEAVNFYEASRDAGYISS